VIHLYLVENLHVRIYVVQTHVDQMLNVSQEMTGFKIFVKAIVREVWHHQWLGKIVTRAMLWSKESVEWVENNMFENPAMSFQLKKRTKIELFTDRIGDLWIQ